MAGNNSRRNQATVFTTKVVICEIVLIIILLAATILVPKNFLKPNSYTAYDEPRWEAAATPAPAWHD